MRLLYYSSSSAPTSSPASPVQTPPPLPTFTSLSPTTNAAAMGSDDPGKQTTALTSATTTQVGPVRSPAADATPFTATTGDEQKQLPVEKSEAASKTPVEVSAPVEEVTEEKSNAGTSTIPAAVEKASDERSSAVSAPALAAREQPSEEAATDPFSC